MANIVKLKHLEHIEDEMLNYGTEGCEAAVRFMRELVKMLGKKSSSAFLQTKLDGAPSVVCCIDPGSKMFFVVNKSVFNKTQAKRANKKPKLVKQQPKRTFYAAYMIHAPTPLKHNRQRGAASSQPACGQRDGARGVILVRLSSGLRYLPPIGFWAERGR